jgi:ornithine cyclodeaminase
MNSQQGVLWVNDEMVAANLPPAEAESVVEGALLLHHYGEYIQPLKPYIRPGGHEREYERGRIIYMPAYLGGDLDIVGIKIIAGFPINVERGLPRASGIYLLNSTKTGFPLCIMECSELSARRTGAIAGLAVRKLGGDGPHTCSIVGGGPIAEAVIRALATNDQVNAITVYDLRIDRAQALATRYNSAQLSVVASPTLTECLNNSQILILATTGSRGYLTRELAGKKRLIIALSLDDASEDLFLSASKVIVDSFDDCCREEKLLHRLVKEGRFSRDQVYAEFGEILAGIKPGRECAQELVYFNPMGMGIEDLACAHIVYQNALQSNAGVWLH